MPAPHTKKERLYNMLSLLLEIAFYLIIALVGCGGLFILACYDDRIID